MEIEELKKVFEKAKTKKISINLNEKTLEMVDDLAEIIGITRTQMIETLISAGFVYQTEYLKKAWEKFLKEKEYKSKKILIEDLLRNLNRFKEKWHIKKIPLPS